MFSKILIANRGEIACRIIKTARRLGIKTVAVYSDADRGALHVALAHEAVHIGPSPANDSYLDVEKILSACRSTGAEAVHPGYGFLSENPDFAQALSSCGLVFIGPPQSAIAAMGDKLISKSVAADAGVNTIPGCSEVLIDAGHAVQVANEIGYPVMLKASAGGGGKGMRIATNDQSCREGFERAASEADASFGDSRILAEKFIERPRHIEIQILADSFGNTVYLAERECSIQRRHQKVIEEAPSPFVDTTMREAIGGQAVALAEAVHYQSAGTVEFIADSDRHFYFLEMNTRLQVEHPVTEYITGIDLVEWMIRVAAGERLTLAQQDIQISGWAVEARIYAEDPYRQFLPSTGRLARYRPPRGSATLRVDTGVFEGDQVSIFYDPLIAKVISHGQDRATSIDILQNALDEFYIQGVSHNIPFLQSLISHPRFGSGDLSTDFVDQEYPNGLHRIHERNCPVSMIVTVATLHRRYQDRAAEISGQLPGHERVVANQWVVVVDGTDHGVSVTRTGRGYEVEYSGQIYVVTTNWEFGDPLCYVSINGDRLCIQIERHKLMYRMVHRGIHAEVMVLSLAAAELNAYMLEKHPPDLSKYLLSPMPGLLLRLAVEVGQEVKAGEELAVVEAMKMENVLRAQHDTKVAAVLAGVGDSLVVDQPIMEFD